MRAQKPLFQGFSRPHSFDFDSDCHFLTNTRNSFGRATKHQSEIATLERIGRDLPPRALHGGFIAHGSEQFHVQRDRLCYAMHDEIAKDVAALRAGLFHTAALESDLRVFGHVEKFRAAQVIVPFLDSGVDTAHLNSGRD